MSDETQRWKEKYLKSIEQQEKLERRWDARLDLLRRGLVRSTLAAEGTDRAVDECMKEMRDVIRTNDMDAGLAALLPRLEKAVLDSEQRRETRVNQTGAALTALVAQLQTLPLPREVSRPLKAFARRLDARVSQAREIPLLLSELSSLQGKALNQLETRQSPTRPGLLQRLFGIVTPMKRRPSSFSQRRHPPCSIPKPSRADRRDTAAPPRLQVSPLPSWHARRSRGRHRTAKDPGISQYGRSPPSAADAPPIIEPQQARAIRWTIDSRGYEQPEVAATPV